MTGYKDTIGAHMTRSPRCIDLGDDLQTAADTMRDMGIRHMPVLERGRPVGMLAERDVALATAFADRPLEDIRVMEAMARIPYCVAPETPVAAAAKHMATRKVDAALIMSGNRILGMFTVTDALNLLSETLEGNGEHQERISA